MKRLLLIACLIGLSGSTTLAATPRPVRQATFNAPCQYPAVPAYQSMYNPQPFRWGWFGAEHYQPAPRTHRDFADGVWQWQYYR